jgi:ribonuclease T1
MARLLAGTRIRVALAALLVGLCVAAPAREAPEAATIALSVLPREGQATYAAIRRGGPFRYDRDGTTFGNREGLLPRRARGYYREYTVDTPGARNRGARRIVCGADSAQWARNAPAACWYTDDHYASFRRIRE